MKKEHKEEAKAVELMEEEKDAPFPFVTRVNHILHLFFSNVEACINNHQILNSKGLYAHKSYIYINFNGAISEYKGVLHCEAYDYEDVPDEIMEAHLSEPFFTWRMKVLTRHDGFLLYGKLGVNFFSTAALLCPNIEGRYVYIESDLFFTCLVTTPTLVLELLIVHFKLVV